MVFYEVIGKLSKEAAAANADAASGEKQKRGLFDKNGRVERDQTSSIHLAVDNLAAQTAPHKMRLDVDELRSDRFIFIVVACFDGLKKYPIKKAVNELLGELELIGEITKVEEITENTYCERLRNAERKNLCSSAGAVRCEYGLDSYSHGFLHSERKIEPVNYGVAKNKPVSLKKIITHAESLVCENLVGEIERIAANKKYGTPVHYTIQMEKMDSCKDVYNFLLDCLKRNGRILRGVVNIWNSNYMQDDYDRRHFSKEDMEKLYNRSEYGAVVIKSDYEEYSGNDAPQYYKQIKQICEVIQANKKNVLTILCFEKGAAKQQKAFLDNLENMTLVDIKETVMFKPDAKKFLSLLAQNDEYKIVDDVCEKLEDGKGYSRIELAQLYSDYYAAHQKAVEFPEYKDFVVIEKKADEKVEGIAYAQLQNMVGLKSVKEQIDNIINFAKVQKLALAKGLKSAALTKHMVFTGNPGTAKTTVARLFAQIMKDNDLLTSGRFVEAGRADLVGQYVGTTAPKVRDRFKQAKGGVLFIDEAYSLVDDKRGLYGDEAINTIVQEMENNRDGTVVILAGYKKEMEGLIDRNSGLKSRVAHYIDFPDYDADELVAILELMAKEQDLTVAGERDSLRGIMKAVVKQDNFGNGRFARNLLDKARLKQAGRVAKMDNPQTEDILTLQAADFELPQEYCDRKNCDRKIRVMGFGCG